MTLNHFFNQGQPLDEVYLDRLAAGIINSVVRAYESRKPRRIRTGFVSVEGIAVNRRTESGFPIDDTAGVIAMEDLDGSVGAIAYFTRVTQQRSGRILSKLRQTSLTTPSSV